MKKPLGLASLLLITSALVAPSLAQAQAAPGGAPDTDAGNQTTSTGGAGTSGSIQAPEDAQADQTQEQAPDVSVPGGEIVVTGRRDANIARATPQVLSVLSSADIARTGEGDIAGALSRVTGLSVVGNGFVYVRGLGDRYSLALLNGSPLPSPEPLRRVVPLDIFPTNVIASSLVQKSYSVNFPGEFGGGVINLTTKAVPTESFLTVGGAIGGDTRTTGQLGYTYLGSKSDWTGFDNGVRDVPPALETFFNGNQRISDIPTGRRQDIAGQLINAGNAVLQRNKALPPNWTVGLTGGTAFDVGGDNTIGVVATFGYSNKWRTRDTTQQTANSADLSSKQTDYERVITDDHVVVNGLVGVGAELGDNRIRWTNLYIRDTLKQARLADGHDFESGDRHYKIQDTAWFERQLIDSQLVGEFKLGSGISLDLRGGYANSQREAPDEISITYMEQTTGPLAGYWINRLNAQQGSATASYSDLNEDLWSGGADLSFRPFGGLTATVGYAYSDTKRISTRRQFQFIAPGDFPDGVTLMRPDYLLGRAVIQAFNVDLVETTESDPSFRATLRNHAGYVQLKGDIAPGLSFDAGVRYETAKQTVAPRQIFATPSSSSPARELDRDYWLPAATLTWAFAPRMQLRINGSKTIARPQFRELLFQQYYDPESNRQFRGNPLLTDSQLYNAEARWEWYFDRDQRLSLSGFYKRIDHPIETFSTTTGNLTTTSFANAPKADLYGAEVETQKYFSLGDSGFFGRRRAVVIANYTFSHSKVKVGPNDTTAAYGFSSTRALDYFLDGRPLTGQSKHLANLEIGLEEQDHLSQQTFLLSYASRRLTSRGPDLTPDIYEYPGFHLDFVARQGIRIAGVDMEAKLEVRNITGTKYQEYQESGSNRIYYNRYNVGTIGMFGLNFNF